MNSTQFRLWYHLKEILKRKSIGLTFFELYCGINRCWITSLVERNHEWQSSSSHIIYAFYELFKDIVLILMKKRIRWIFSIFLFHPHTLLFQMNGKTRTFTATVLVAYISSGWEQLGSWTQINFPLPNVYGN